MTVLMQAKVTGVLRASAVIKNVLTRRRVNDAMKQVSNFMEEEIKNSIAGRRAEKRSVDTGQFMRSITNEPGDLKVTMISNVKQAGFLEFGTRFITPRNHFRNSVFRNQSKIMDFIRSKIRV